MSEKESFQNDSDAPARPSSFSLSGNSLSRRSFMKRTGMASVAFLALSQLAEADPPPVAASEGTVLTRLKYTVPAGTFFETSEPDYEAGLMIATAGLRLKIQNALLAGTAGYAAGKEQWGVVVAGSTVEAADVQLYGISISNVPDPSDSNKRLVKLTCSGEVSIVYRFKPQKPNFIRFVETP